MADGIAPVDPRRASQLRAELAASAAMLAPDWSGLQHEGDFGAALVEIAARLAEHSTTRLDQTPLRDKLAFFDALDVATPAPRPATVPIVFTLAERRETPVFAPPRVQLSAEPSEAAKAAGDKDAVTFETRTALAITPARLADLLAVDPAVDRIERAPGHVTMGFAEGPPPTRYRLLSAVETEAKTLQLVQAVGIAPDDMLRIGAGVYRVEKADGAIVHLRDPLAGPSPAGAQVDKLIALEAFALRDLQRHALYVGHKELLKLDGPAEIVLVFDPPDLPARLAALDLEYSMWGTKEDEADPDWQPLDLIRGGPAGLRLAKNWQGSADELELPCGTSRWVRLRLRTPMAGAGGPVTRAASVAIRVSSPASVEGEATEGSETIAAAFYNGQPLATASAFYPFGPEPQRFDIFALSAPEALSKKGAKLKLTVTLDGPSLDSMAYATGAPGGPAHVYGVSGNGRLQAVYFDDEGKGEWRQIGLAQPDSSPSATDGGGVKLDPVLPMAAVRVGDKLDLVFVSGADAKLRLVRIGEAEPQWTILSWETVSGPGDEAVAAFRLLPGIAGVNAGRLLIATESGFYARTIETSGALSTSCPRVGSIPGTAAVASFAVADAGSDAIALVSVDIAGTVYRGDLAGNGPIAWRRFGNGGRPAPLADPAVAPAAIVADGKLLLIGRRMGQTPPLSTSGRFLAMDEDGTERQPPRPPAIGTPLSVTGLAADPDGGSARPLVVAAGDAGMLVWSVGQDGDEDDALVLPLPAGVATPRPSVLLLPPIERGKLPQLLINAGGEQLLYARVGPAALDLRMKLHDILRHDESQSEPTHLIVRSAAPIALQGPWVSLGSRPGFAAQPTPTALPVGQSYLLVADTGLDLAGSAVAADDRQLALDLQDSVTAEGDRLVIGGATFEVKVRDDGASPSIVTLDRSYGTSTSYRPFKKTDSRRVMDSDRLRLAELDREVVDASALAFPSGVVPRVQPADGAAVKDSKSWIALSKAWIQPPPAEVDAALTVGMAVPAWSSILLPRGADNPELSWEYYDGAAWQRLERSGFADGTGNLAHTGDIVFTVPADIAPGEVAGKDGYWIRARLIGGDYGRPAYLVDDVPVTGDDKRRTSITIDRSRLNPPEILSIEASYRLDTAIAPDLVIAENNLAVIDQTQAALTGGAVFKLFESVAQHVGDSDNGGRTLYFGFSRAPGVDQLGLYADAADRDDDPVELAAEAWRADGWRPIDIDDDTDGLTRPGMIRLGLSPPPAQLPLFGRDGWWLRLRPKGRAAGWAPLIRGLFVNAVMAEHARSIRDELLGSSSGAPDQLFQLAQRPVLPETLELRVRESLGTEERARIEKDLGGGAIVGPDDKLVGTWVLWRRVETFVDEDGGARIYRLDPASGEIRFGNGRRGKIPPAGADSIRAFSYQKGGGSVGNVPARAVDTLASAIESVELAINPVDAAGGADPPRADRIAASAPAFLRHAGRALAPADIEALAVGSSPDVVRARCLARGGCSIRLAVAIAGSGTRCPMPSRARREGIARNISAAGWGALAPDAVIVVPPRYVRVRVEAEVLATSAEAVPEVARSVREALAAFLHPIAGGPDATGWPFGRRVWESDLQRVIAAVEGVDRTISVTVEPQDRRDSLAAMPPEGLVCVETEDIVLVVRPPEGAP